jgi:hypothetical protein
MLMSVISLTWEIKGQPNCARKQVCISDLSFVQYIKKNHVPNLFLLLTERRGTFSVLGHNARICDDVAE